MLSNYFLKLNNNGNNFTYNGSNFQLFFTISCNLKKKIKQADFRSSIVFMSNGSKENKSKKKQSRSNEIAECSQVRDCWSVWIHFEFPHCMNYYMSDVQDCHDLEKVEIREIILKFPKFRKFLDFLVNNFNFS